MRVGRIVGALLAVLMVLGIGTAALQLQPRKTLRLSTETEKELHLIQMPAGPMINVTPAPAEAPKEKIQVLELRDANTIMLRGEVTSVSMAKLQEEILRKSQELSDRDSIYLTLDTPGGDIDAGNSFIDMARALPQKVKTVTLFAASMGFHIAQNLDERMIVPSGTLMSHRAKVGGMAGEIPGELVTRVNFLLKMLTNMESIAADRMQMSLPAYQDLIKDEYWVTGRDSVQAKVADKMVLARCGKDLLGTYQEEVQVFIFKINVTFSRCPMIQGPLKIDFGSNKFETEKQKQEVQEYLNDLFFHKMEFVRKHRQFI